MRQESEVIGRIVSLLSDEWVRRSSTRLSVHPNGCQHHHWHQSDVRRTTHEGEPNLAYNRVDLANGRIGLCMYGAQDITSWKGDVCEDLIDALKCPLFQPNWTMHQVYADLLEDLQDASWLTDNLPTVAALCWVLPEINQPVVLPWWKRLWNTLLGKSDTVAVPLEPHRLLPPLAELPAPIGLPAKANP